MRTSFAEKLEEGRHHTGRYATRRGDSYGAFDLMGPCGEVLFIIAAASADFDIAEGWDHVSVSTKRRIPNWIEMSFVKDLFWSEDEWAVQFHPAKSEYVNNHPNVLHLWWKAGFPTPPSGLVGDKTRGVLTREEVRKLMDKG